MLEARFGDDPLTTWDIRYCAKKLHATVSGNYVQINSKIVKQICLKFV